MTKRISLQVSKMNPSKKKSKKQLRAAAKKGSKEAGDSDVEGLMEEVEEDIEMPPDNILYKLVDRLEAQLPRDDHVKYDSRYTSLRASIGLNN